MRIAFDTEPNASFPLYGRAHSASMFPDVLSPLAWTIIVSPLEGATRDTLCRRFRLMPPQRDEELVALGRFAGRLYINVSFLRMAMAGAPGWSSEFTDAEFGGMTLEDVSPIPRVGWWRRLTKFGPILRTMATQPAERAVLRRRLRTAIADDERLLTSGATDAALAARLGERQALMRSWLAAHQLVRGSAMGSADMVERMCARWGVADEVVPALFAGLDDVESTTATLELWDVASWIRTQPSLASDVLAGCSYSDLVAAGHGASVEAARRLGAFLGRYGHRGFTECDPTRPAWGDDPEGVMALLRQLLKAAGDTDPRQRQEATRRRGLRQLRVQVGPARYVVLVMALRSARRGIKQAEETKSAIVRMAHDTRHILTELRIRWGDTVPSELFSMMSLDELGQTANGHTVDVAELQRRKAEHDAAEMIEVPNIIGPADLVPAPPPDTGHVIDGMAASPGRHTGTAFVVADPAGPMADGDVLVAHTTDTAWTPLFLAASAVVTDLGSPMGHASIVARDLGIPAVVGTKHASRLIHDGDITTVDGDRGQVIIGQP